MAAGAGTSNVTWGDNRAGALAPSALTFTGNAFSDVATGQVFPLGTLTYVNGTDTPASLIFGLTMHLSAGDGITPFTGPVAVVSTQNGNADRAADADLPSFSSFEVPSTLAAFEGTAVTATIFGRIVGGPQLEVTSIALAEGQGDHGCVDAAPLAESTLPCAPACGEFCAASPLGPLCGSEQLPAALNRRIGQARHWLSQASATDSERKAKKAVTRVMSSDRETIDNRASSPRASSSPRSREPSGVNLPSRTIVGDEKGADGEDPARRPTGREEASTMVARRALFVAASTAWVCGLGAVPSLAAFPGELQVGTRVEVKGRLLGPRVMVAERIEIDTRPGGEDGLGGVIDSVDANANTLTVLGIKIATSSQTALEGESREPIVFADFKGGQWVSVDGTLGEDGVLKASEVRIKPPKRQGARDPKLEGRVSQVDGTRNTFTLLGATVSVTPHTQVVKKRAGGGGE